MTQLKIMNEILEDKYIDMSENGEVVILDDNFTLEELEIIIKEMKKRNDK